MRTEAPPSGDVEPASSTSSIAAPETPSPRAWLSGSGWLLAQGRSASLSEPLLGGSQAGVRLFVGHGPIVPTLRVSRALGALPQGEVGFGLAYRRGPAVAIFERRVSVDGGRDAFAVTLAANLAPVPLPARLTLSGYAEAGIVGLRRRDGFAGGRLDLLRPTGDRVELGLGGWAAAQPGVTRVELGPQIVLRPRLAGQATRLSLEYRVRAAGDARPKSGPALTMGVDF